MSKAIARHPKVPTLLQPGGLPWLEEMPQLQRQQLVQGIGSFLDSVGSATDRASFYNSREEQNQAVQQAHQSMFGLERGLYALMLALPGTTDYSRQMGLLRLLSNPRDEGQPCSLSQAQEQQVVEWLLKKLSPPRMLKLFGMFKEQRINNARSRKLIQRSILSSPKLELWSTRYRRKLRVALTHAWGVRQTSILKQILAKEPEAWDAKERGIARKQVLRFAGAQKPEKVLECVAFVLGCEEHLSLPMLQAYHRAKADLEAGACLPFETLEGLRSTFHKDKSSEQVLELTKGKLTRGQKMQLQRKAEQAGVEVEFDPRRYDAVKLYTYAFARGCDEALQEALHAKAKAAAERFPMSFEKVGILVDASASMRGAQTQALRPMSIALATRDLLEQIAATALVLYVGGEADESGILVRPAGETSLAQGAIQLLQERPDAVFVLSDGYENAPAGRFSEVMEQVRQLGIETPVYQLSPVLSAEAGGVRALCPSLVPAMPVLKPDAMGLVMLKGMLLQEPQRAIQGLIRMVSGLMLGDTQPIALSKEVKHAR